MQCVSLQPFKLGGTNMTIHQIVMPQLGESVTEGTIERWIVKVGDQVQKYDPLAEVTTDKVTAEIPSSYAGTIKEILIEEGETIPVGTPVCTIEVEEEAEIEQTMTNNHDESNHKISTIEHNNSGKQRYSPAVLRLASEHNIDLTLIRGTGLGGRITRKDVLAYIEKQNAEISESITFSKIKITDEDMIETSSGDIEIPITSVRRTIANHMVKSKTEIPHAWMMMEADVTNLVKYREKIKHEFEKSEGFKLTYFPFFVKAAAIALREFPMMNSVWNGDKIIQRKDIHISIAVATDDALFVPVIKNADEKSVKRIAKDIHEMSILARNGNLKMEHIMGGTFTVNNTGSFGSVQSMGIINYPQAGILQVESIKKRPVIVNDAIAIRDIVNLCLSIDHRILDGLISSKFLRRVIDILENVQKYEMLLF